MKRELRFTLLRMNTESSNKPNVTAAFSTKKYFEYIKEIAAAAIESVIDAPNTGKVRRLLLGLPQTLLTITERNLYPFVHCEKACEKMKRTDLWEGLILAWVPIKYITQASVRSSSLLTMGLSVTYYMLKVS